MAKKAVASFKKADGRTYSKVIKMVKSPKTGPQRSRQGVLLLIERTSSGALASL